jgi:hypothetical protein
MKNSGRRPTPLNRPMNMKGPVCNTDGSHDYLQEHQAGLAEGHTKLAGLDQPVDDEPDHTRAMTARYKKRS